MTAIFSDIRKHNWRIWSRRSAFLAVLGLVYLGGCNRKKEQRVPIETAPVVRRTIVSEATASGQIEPINIIEVKSKSSGQIIQMPVETGSEVKPGDLLVQLDPRDVNQQLQQALADSVAAAARLAVSKAQKERSDRMFQEKIITAQEHEAAQLDYANAEAAFLRAAAAVDIARQRVEEATVRAPVAGTIISKPVSLGQVIASATNSPSGGTTLLTMADLSKVRMRANFNETDIGNVKPGQPATVTVDAYPDRPFQGIVEKIEPQATVVSSVTMFPVLITLDNPEGLLKPGMNGEVSVLVDRRENVLAVPNDAVRQTREAGVAAKLVGLDPDSVTAAVQQQLGAGRGGGVGSENGGRGAEGQGNRTGRFGSARGEARGDVAPTLLAAEQPEPALQQEGRRGGRQGGFGQLPQVSDQDCQKVRSALERKPEAERALQGLRGRMQGGEIDMQQLRAISDSIYRSLGVDPGVARACQMRARGEGSSPAGPAGSQPSVAGAAGRGAPPAGIPQGTFAGARRMARPALVFVAQGNGFVPRVFRAGLSDLDYTEVVSGLEEGERVVLLGALAMQAQRDSALARMRQGMGGGIPGMQRNAQGTTPIGGPGGPGRGRGF
jgi:HlyD family secretion protein